MFRFANPQYLWLLAAVPALVALFWLAMRNRRRRLARFGRPETLGELMPEVSTGRVKFRFVLFCTAVALTALAAARPQLGSKLREEKAQGIEMMLAVDVSNSMLAEDFEPNRLERTKYAIGKLFEGLRQDRVGLIVFAGEPKVQLPITSDYRMARAFARRIDPSLVPVQGTAVGKALEQALLAFDDSFEEALLAAEDQRNDRAETCPAVRDALQVAEAVVRGEVVPVGGVAGRMDARRAAERLDLEARVVGEAVAPGAVVEVVRLLRSVAFEGFLLFGNLLRDAAFAWRHEREAVAQNGLHLLELVCVVGCKDDLHIGFSN